MTFALKYSGCYLSANPWISCIRCLFKTATSGMILLNVGDGATGASLRMRQALPLLSDPGSHAVAQCCYAELPKSLYSRVLGEMGSKTSSRAPRRHSPGLCEALDTSP